MTASPISGMGTSILLLQPHLDEGPEDNLEAHRELERGRRLPRQDPSRSRTSCVSQRRTFVLFMNIAISCRPS